MGLSSNESKRRENDSTEFDRPRDFSELISADVEEDVLDMEHGTLRNMVKFEKKKVRLAFTYSSQ
jgi:hypothetical protein